MIGHEAAKVYKVLVCGSREWSDAKPIHYALEAIAKRHAGKYLVLVHGAQRKWSEELNRDVGADSIAGKEGKLLGYEVRPYPAQWKQFGHSAGPRRNQTMLDAEHPDKRGHRINLVLAFHDLRFYQERTGTQDMLQRACSAGIPARILVEPWRNR